MGVPVVPAVGVLFTVAVLVVNLTPLREEIVGQQQPSPTQRFVGTRAPEYVVTLETRGRFTRQRVCLEYSGSHILSAQSNRGVAAATAFLTLDDGSEEGEFVANRHEVSWSAERSAQRAGGFARWGAVLFRVDPERRAWRGGDGAVAAPMRLWINLGT